LPVYGSLFPELLTLGYCLTLTLLTLLSGHLSQHFAALSESAVLSLHDSLLGAGAPLCFRIDS